MDSFVYQNLFKIILSNLLNTGSYFQEMKNREDVFASLKNKHSCFGNFHVI